MITAASKKINKIQPKRYRAYGNIMHMCLRMWQTVQKKYTRKVHLKLCSVGFPLSITKHEDHL